MCYLLIKFTFPLSQIICSLLICLLPLLVLLFSLIQVGEFVLRKPIFGYPELIALFLGFLFIGIARMANEKTIQNVWGIFLNFKTEIKFTDSVKIDSFGSFSLILNFIVSSSLLVFLSTENLINTPINHYLFSILFTFFFLLIYLIGFYLVGFITGSMKQLTLGIIYNQNFIHIAGIICLLISIPWLLNPNRDFILFPFSLISLGLLYSIRLVKIFMASFRENIPLYYIILYLCTLEIYPIYMFVRVYDKFFGF